MWLFRPSSALTLRWTCIVLCLHWLFHLFPFRPVQTLWQLHTVFLFTLHFFPAYWEQLSHIFNPEFISPFSVWASYCLISFVLMIMTRLSVHFFGDELPIKKLWSFSGHNWMYDVNGRLLGDKNYCSLPLVLARYYCPIQTRCHKLFCKLVPKLVW